MVLFGAHWCGAQATCLECSQVQSQLRTRPAFRSLLAKSQLLSKVRSIQLHVGLVNWLKQIFMRLVRRSMLMNLKSDEPTVDSELATISWVPLKGWDWNGTLQYWTIRPLSGKQLYELMAMEVAPSSPPAFLIVTGGNLQGQIFSPGVEEGLGDQWEEIP